jgi:AcrR family transcriptional regulator
MPYAQPSGRLMADDRKRHLLDVAARIIVDSGVDSLTMEGLAKEAGVSNALPYHYFPNAASVITTLAEEEWAWVDNEIAAGIAEAKTYEEKIVAGLRPYLEGLVSRGPAFPIFMITRSYFEPLAKLQLQREAEIIAFWTEMGVSNLGLDEGPAHAAAGMLLGASIGAFKMAWLDNTEREELENMLMLMVKASVRDLRRKAREESRCRVSAGISG